MHPKHSTVISARTGRKSDTQQNRIRFFSLVELLVVIAVIAILAGLLMPALNKAREKGLAIQCLGNMKQSRQILMLYQNDYEDMIPQQVLWNGASLGWVHPLMVGGYLPKAEKDGASYYLNKNKITFCPKTAPNMENSNAVLRTCGIFIPSWSGADYESRLGNILTSESNLLRSAILASRLKTSPSATMLLADNRNGVGDKASANERVNSWAWVTETGNSGGYISAWHTDRQVNTAFFDGHAETRNVRRLYDTPNKCHYYFDINGIKTPVN